MAPPEGPDTEHCTQRENGLVPRSPLSRSRRGQRSPRPARPEPRSPSRGCAHPPPPRRDTRGKESFPSHLRGKVSYLWAPHGSLCRNIAPWQVAASLSAPASPLPARRGRFQHPWQRGGQPGTGSREATQGQRQVGALELPAFVVRISSRPRGRTQRCTAPCPLNRTGLLITVAPLKG